jgi:peptidoglycan-associated lipoprotein
MAGPIVRRATTSAVQRGCSSGTAPNLRKDEVVRTQALFLLACIAALTACGSKPPAEAPPTAQAAPPPIAQPAAKPAPPADTPTQSNLAISDEIRRACGITDAEAFFAFDSANVRPQDRIVLKKLADCFSTGPLKGRRMRLVGHADPRGDEEYNRVLGQRRADSVKGAIATAGLDSGKMETTSRGEDDANGTDDNGWSKDRRVDVLLGS